MANEQNMAVVRRFFEEVFNSGNLEVLDQIVDRDAVYHDPSTPDFGKGPEAARKIVGLYRSAFPDVRITIEDMISDADKVVTRWSARGTHRGEFTEISPTGKTVSTTGIQIDRVVGGKVMEGWGNWDALGLMQQLGAIPALEATARRR